VKQFVATLICLLLVLSSASAEMVANETPACDGCGCATMSCCPSDSTPADPISNVPERVQTQKIIALQPVVTPDGHAFDELHLQHPSSPRANMAPSVPLFVRNCQFLM